MSTTSRASRRSSSATFCWSSYPPRRTGTVHRVSPPRVLRLLNTTYHTSNSANGTPAAQPTSWVNVLHLATRWGFADVREAAIVRIADDEDCIVFICGWNSVEVSACIRDAPCSDVLCRTT